MPLRKVATGETILATEWNDIIDEIELKISRLEDVGPLNIRNEDALALVPEYDPAMPTAIGGVLGVLQTGSTPVLADLIAQLFDLQDAANFITSLGSLVDRLRLASINVVEGEERALVIGTANSLEVDNQTSDVNIAYAFGGVTKLNLKGGTFGQALRISASTEGQTVGSNTFYPDVDGLHIDLNLTGGGDADGIDISISRDADPATFPTMSESLYGTGLLCESANPGNGIWSGFLCPHRRK